MTSRLTVRSPLRKLRMALLVLATMACTNSRPPETTPPSPRVVVETAAGGRHAVTVEIARTEEERARGLMFRTALAPDAGMLFIFETTAVQGFWMLNTYIPLDMIFLDEEGRIVGIVESATPRSTEIRAVDVPSRYVLEVNGGWSAAHGVASGDRVRFENVMF